MLYKVAQLQRERPRGDLLQNMSMRLMISMGVMLIKGWGCFYSCFSGPETVCSVGVFWTRASLCVFSAELLAEKASLPFEILPEQRWLASVPHSWHEKLCIKSRQCRLVSGLRRGVIWDICQMAEERGRARAFLDRSCPRAFITSQRG